MNSTEDMSTTLSSLASTVTEAAANMTSMMGQTTTAAINTVNNVITTVQTSTETGKVTPHGAILPTLQFCMGDPRCTWDTIFFFCVQINTKGMQKFARSVSGWSLGDFLLAPA